MSQLLSVLAKKFVPNAKRKLKNVLEVAMKNKPISNKILKEWENARSIADVFEQEIIDRIDYIINEILKTFDQKLDTWYFHDAGEGSLGDLSPNLDEKNVSFVYEIARDSDSEEMVILLKNGFEYSLHDGEFPTRWLFEDFEEELIQGKKDYEEKEEEKKRRKRKNL